MLVRCSYMYMLLAGLDACSVRVLDSHCCWDGLAQLGQTVVSYPTGSKDNAIIAKVMACFTRYNNIVLDHLGAPYK